MHGYWVCMLGCSVFFSPGVPNIACAWCGVLWIWHSVGMGTNAVRSCESHDSSALELCHGGSCYDDQLVLLLRHNLHFGVIDVCLLMK